MPRTFRSRMHAGRSLTLTGLLAVASPLLGATNTPAADANTNAGPDVVRDLRVYSVQPRVFEYLFTGASTGPVSNSAPLLYFRDLAGNTPAVRLSEPLGPYTVTGFTPRKTRVFKETVNAYLDADTSSVTLRDAAGSNRVLTVGKPWIEPGLMACLVSVASGGWGHVRGGDALDIEGVDVTVIGITMTSALVRANARDLSIPLVTDAERTSVLALWESRRREAEAQQARALALAEEKRQQAARLAAEVAAAAQQQPPPQLTVGPTQEYNYGYEGYYPSQFDVVPYTYYYPNGQSFTQGILVPSCYERHRGGRDHDDGHDHDGNHWRH